jgi:hypothetical protein
MLCIASHDAGGAELLASWLARQSQSYRLLLDGPALRVFERRLNGSLVIVSEEEALWECDHFLTGSSWQSDLEWRVIGAARSLGKPVVTFLDHWVHYRERFIRGGREHLPDAIWTGDQEAFNMALGLFPEVRVELVSNPYFEDIRSELASFASSSDSRSASTDGISILFVCEPLSEHGLAEYGDTLHWGYTEFDALRYFFDHQSLLGDPVREAVIRPHPSEKVGKYDSVARELRDRTGIPVRVGGDVTLLQEIAHSDVVVGCESMAMVVGLIACRRVISAIPPGGLSCSLPHDQIESLQVLAAAARMSATSPASSAGQAPRILE